MRTGSCRILDVGGTEYYWNIARSFLTDAPVQIHILNLQPASVTGPQFVSMTGDATELGCLEDNSFDFVHSNSVIEHVGDFKRMFKMANHIRRLAPVYYVQTPYFWFPYEPHFRTPLFHWFPEQIRYRLLMNFNLGFFERKESVETAMTAVQSCSMLDRRQLRDLFPDSHIISERFFGLTKSLMAIRG